MYRETPLWILSFSPQLRPRRSRHVGTLPAHSKLRRYRILWRGTATRVTKLRLLTPVARFQLFPIYFPAIVFGQRRDKLDPAGVLVKCEPRLHKLLNFG